MTSVNASGCIFLGIVELTNNHAQNTEKLFTVVALVLLLCYMYKM